MEMAGYSPSMSSTRGFCIWERNCLAYAESDSTYLLWPSAYMVSNASDDFPDPLTPVQAWAGATAGSVMALIIAVDLAVAVLGGADVRYALGGWPAPYGIELRVDAFSALLLLIVTGIWPLLKTVTAFTLAHSLTLALATLGYATAPVPPLNAAIALSILFLGPEIVRSWRGETSFTIRHPWVVAFAFGLLHGFGFASGLNTIGIPRAEIPVALLLFNVGVEFGQIAFVVLILLLERSFRILEILWPRWVKMAPGYAVGSLGAYWFIQRTIVLIGGLR